MKSFFLGGVWVCVCVRACVCVCLCVHACMYMNMCTCMSVCMHVCISVCFQKRVAEHTLLWKEKGVQPYTTVYRVLHSTQSQCRQRPRPSRLSFYHESHCTVLRCDNHYTAKTAIPWSPLLTSRPHTQPLWKRKDQALPTRRVLRTSHTYRLWSL